MYISRHDLGYIQKPETTAISNHQYVARKKSHTRKIEEYGFVVNPSEECRRSTSSSSLGPRMSDYIIHIPSTNQSRPFCTSHQQKTAQREGELVRSSGHSISQFQLFKLDKFVLQRLIFFPTVFNARGIFLSFPLVIRGVP